MRTTVACGVASTRKEQRAEQAWKWTVHSAKQETALHES